MSNPRSTSIALAATGAVIATNSLAFGTQLFFDPSSFSEIGGSSTHRTYYVVLLLCVASLSLVLPRLTDVTGSTGRTLPGAVLTFVGLGVFFDGGTRFVEAFVVPYLADFAPELLNDTPASGLMYAMVTAWILYMASLVLLGVTAYRRRVFPRAACVLIIIGGASVPLLGPLSGILIGAGLTWSGIAAAGRPAHQKVPVGSAVATG